MNDTDRRTTGTGVVEGTGRFEALEASHLLAGVVVTGAVSLALVPADAGVEPSEPPRRPSRSPCFVWEIQSGRDQVLLLVLFVASLVAALAGTRLHRRHLTCDA